MPLLDRDEAERLPVVIPQEDIDNAPEAFAWYEGPQGGGFTVPYQFKKYPNRPVNETPMGYLHYIVDKCNCAHTKNIHSTFFDAIQVYFEGLMEYARDHYAGFVIPFGTKHRGKRLQQCRDKPWIEWTTKKPSLTAKYTVYFTAVQYFLADTRHYNANRDIGQLLSATEYEDDLDLEEEEDDGYENDSFIDDGDIEEREEEESSEAADEFEASSSTEESTQASNTEGSQSNVSDSFDSEPYAQTPPRKIPLLNDTTSLGTAYRLGKRRDSFSPSPALPPPSTLRKRRRASPDFGVSPLVSPISKANSACKASPRKHRFSSVDSLDHPEYSDDTEKNESEVRQQSRSRKSERPETRRRQIHNDGKSSPVKGGRSYKRKRGRLASDAEDFISSAGGEEDDGSDEYIDSTTENDTSMDTENDFEPRQLRLRKRPSDDPCVLEEILSAETSLSNIATELSSGVIALLSDNEQDSGVIVISSDSEPEQDESKGQSHCTRRKRGSPESDLDVQSPCPKRRRASAIRRHVSSSEGSPSRSPSPERSPTKLRRLRRWTES